MNELPRGGGAVCATQHSLHRDRARAELGPAYYPRTPSVMTPCEFTITAVLFTMRNDILVAHQTLRCDHKHTGPSAWYLE